jgi:hypothetical protein
VLGARGQFDVLVDGELIASRSRGFVSRLMTGGWPDPDAVITALRARAK